MAESDEIKKEQELKYLDFVQVAVLQVLAYIASLYDLAKESSGPLKPGVQSVESSVRSVVGPLFEKFHDVPLELLRFVDRKVDGAAREVERHVPEAVKRASSQACAAAQKAPEAARSVTDEVRRSGVVDTAAGMAKVVYAKYEPAVERQAAALWRWLNGLPLFPQAAQVAVPTAAHWAERYNRAVGCAAEQGYAAAAYLPLVPTERIGKVFGGGGAYRAVPIEEVDDAGAADE